MEITCAQMDVLLSFYVEGDLSRALKAKVEEHLKKCPACREKYEIIKTMIQDLKTSVGDREEIYSSKSNGQYRIFQNNLSAYVDNELPQDESIKIKKYTINNKQARKELEDTYNIRRLMSESFNKTKLDAKQDFARNVLRQLNPNEDYSFSIHPVLKLAAAFVMTVLILSAIIDFSLKL